MTDLPARPAGAVLRQAQDERGDASLHRKLLGLTAFRVVLVTVLLGGASVAGWRGGEEAIETVAPLFGLVVVAYAAALASAVLLERRQWLVATAWSHVILDVGVAAVIVAVTNRSESVFVFMYSIAIVNGAILLYRGGALAATAMAVAAHLVVTSPLLGHPTPAITLFTQAGAFLATGALASYLAEQLRRTGETLAARESDLAVITALHETIVQSMTSGLLTLDPAGRITFLNRAGEAMSGLQAAAAVGRPASELFPAFQTETGRGEVELENREGVRLLMGYSTFPLVVEGGTSVGKAVIFQDLTRLRAMEEAMQRGARLADLGRVAAGLAHELRNPLASMSGSLELLAAQGAASEEDRRLMGIVLRESSRLNDLVSDFLRFARPPPLRRTPTDVAALLDETLRVFANDPAAARVRVVRELTPARVPCDADQLRGVVWNLLVNAAHAVAARPDPAAGVGEAPGSPGTLRVSCAPEGRGVRIDVEDDGAGIPPEDTAKIFMPFFTTKERGSGLGLATVHRVVDAHGGTVQVSSAPGQGTRFTVRLPDPSDFAPEPGAATLAADPPRPAEPPWRRSSS